MSLNRVIAYFCLERFSKPGTVLVIVYLGRSQWGGSLRETYIHYMVFVSFKFCTLYMHCLLQINGSFSSRWHRAGSEYK